MLNAQPSTLKVLTARTEQIVKTAVAHVCKVQYGYLVQQDSILYKIYTTKAAKLEKYKYIFFHYF